MSGLKSLAQELPKYGRNGDTMVAHINSQEADLLKALGGSGTTNPHTGLPEFGMFGIGGGGGFLGTGINKGASDPVSNALSNNPVSKGVSNLVQSGAGAIDQGLVGLDKTVGKVIPGGWGTVASIAGSIMGVPTPYLVGLGALNGSGVMHKGGKFNLQGAMMGGAMAYAASELGEYARGAVPSGIENAPVDMSGATAPVSGGITSAPIDSIEALNQSQGWTGPNATDVGSNIPQNAITAANNAPAIAADAASRINPATNLQYGSVIGDTLAGNAPVTPSIGSQIMSGNFGDALSQVGTNISEGATNAYNSAANFADKATNLDTYTNALDRGVTNAGKTASGVGNLLGLGEGSSSAASAAARAAATTAGTMSPITAAGMGIYAGMGLAALDEQKKYLEESKKANTISQAEYDSAMAEINRSTENARTAVKENPFSSERDTTPISYTETAYGKSDPYATLYGKSGATERLYAAGGQVALPPDDQTNMASQSPINSLSQYQQMQQQSAGLQSPLSTIEQTSASQSGGSGFSPQNFYGGYGGGQNAGLGAMSNNNSNNAFPLQGQYGIVKMASGGMLPPRFLSGGGDGMSDSIHANIGGNQEARLADGEFVIPADVVSHLGNGSSKAGAKQLYSMMNKVRKARTGTAKQGRQINPNKYLAA